jgi:hypothetical protein
MWSSQQRSRWSRKAARSEGGGDDFKFSQAHDENLMLFRFLLRPA